MVSTKKVVKTAIITALTLAVALIWRDVIVSALSTLFPPNNLLLSQLIVAILSTIIIIVIIIIFLKTEQEAQEIVNRFKIKNKK